MCCHGNHAVLLGHSTECLKPSKCYRGCDKSFLFFAYRITEIALNKIIWPMVVIITCFHSLNCMSVRFAVSFSPLGGCNIDRNWQKKPIDQTFWRVTLTIVVSDGNIWSSSHYQGGILTPYSDNKPTDTYNNKLNN